MHGGLARVVKDAGQTERRIGEIQIAVGREDEIVGTVETVAVIAIRHDGDRAIRFEPADLAIAMPAKDEPSIGVQRQPVGSRLFPGERRRAAVPAAREEQTDAFAGLPFVDAVRRNIREEQVAALLMPDRSFHPREPVGNFLQPRLRRHELGEAQVQRVKGGPVSFPDAAASRRRPQREAQDYDTETHAMPATHGAPPA